MGLGGVVVPTGRYLGGFSFSLFLSCLGGFFLCGLLPACVRISLSLSCFVFLPSFLPSYCTTTPLYLSESCRREIRRSTYNGRCIDLSCFGLPFFRPPLSTQYFAEVASLLRLFFFLFTFSFFCFSGLV